MNKNTQNHSPDSGKNVPVYTRETLENMFLPIKQMLQLDRVTEIHKGSILCEIDLSTHWVFPLHFPGDPIFPGSLLIEAVGQATAVWAWHEGFRGHPRLVKVSAKFEGPALPDDGTIVLDTDVRQRKNVFIGNGKVIARNCAIAAINVVLILIPV